MSIYNSSNDPVTTAINQVYTIIKQEYDQKLRSALKGYALIWNNPNATPQQIITGFGTNCKSVFDAADLNGETLVEAAGVIGATVPTLPSIPPQYTLTFQTDGSGVLTGNNSAKNKK